MYTQLVDVRFNNKFEYFNIFNDPTIYKLFVNDTQFQIAMLVIVTKLKELS